MTVVSSDRSPRAVALVALGARARAGRRRVRRSSDGSERAGRRASGGEGRQARVRLPDHDAELRSQEMALGAKAAADDTQGVKLTECRARTGSTGPKQVQLFQAADAHVQGRHRDDDD